MTTQNERPLGPETFGNWIDRKGWIYRGPGKLVRSFAEQRANGIFVDVIAMRLIAGGVLHSEFLEAVLPDGHFGFEAKGEASFDILHCLLNGDVGGGRDEEVEVVGHEDEGVELVAAFCAVIVEYLEEEIGVGVGLKEAAAIGGDGGDEEGSNFLRGSLHRSKLERGAAGGKITSVWLWGRNGKEWIRGG